MHKLQRSWVRSQHPSAQWNLRGCRWSSAEYCTNKKKKIPPKNILKKKLSGWWEISSTFAMDIFGFFQHFRWKFLTFSKFSDYNTFSKDGNPLCFEVFWLNFHCKGWKSPTFRSFPFKFHCKGCKSTTFRRFPIIFLFQRMEIPKALKRLWARRF